MKLSKYVKRLSENSFVKKEEEVVPLTTEEKKAVLKMVSEYNKIGEAISRTSNIKQVTENMAKMIEGASKLALQETDDWFDRGMVEKSMKAINENYKLFEKAAGEMYVLQQKLEHAYDAIGSGLNQYYKIND